MTAIDDDQLVRRARQRDGFSLWLDRAIAAALLIAAAAWAWSMFATLANFGLRYPAFDQYKFYPNYLSLPFPESAVQLENGHRTLFPSLVRLAEMQWFKGGQSLQLTIGAMLLFGTLAVMSAPAWRERSSNAIGAACVFLCTIGICWLAQARMQIHGNEILHVYTVMFFGGVALLCVDTARRRNPVFFMAAGSACCIVATFSFGSGISSFAAMLLMAVLMRIPARAFALPLASLLAVVTAYVAGMPGDDGVRDSIAIRPIDNVIALSRFLAAPGMHAWLGLADPALYDWMPRSVGETSLGSLLIRSLGVFPSTFGTNGRAQLAVAIGAFGTLSWTVMLAHAGLSSGALSRTRLVAFGMASLGLAVGAIICLARLEHFDRVPHDVFAERYLPWSTLFWLGLVLYVVSGTRSLESARGGVVVATAILASLVVYPTHRTWAEWSAVVHRNNVKSAVVAQLGALDPALFPNGADASAEDVRRTLDLLRQQRLAMYSETDYLAWENRWRAPLAEMAAMQVPIVIGAASFTDANGRLIQAVEGSVQPGTTIAQDTILLIVDAKRALRGIAKFTFLGNGESALRWDVPPKRGFDGYVIEPAADEIFDMLALDSETLALRGHFRLGTLAP